MPVCLVPTVQKRRIDLFSSELSGLKPSRLGDVFKLGFRVREVEDSVDQMSQEPELDVPTLWIDQVLDVREAANFDPEPGFLPYLTRGGFLVAFFALDAATRGDPEVVAPGPDVVNQEKTALVFNDGTGGDSIGVQV